jgi:hypothetical protein
MRLSVRTAGLVSLSRLRTRYISLLYRHGVPLILYSRDGIKVPLCDARSLACNVSQIHQWHTSCSYVVVRAGWCTTVVDRASKKF